MADKGLDTYYKVVASNCKLLETFCDIEENKSANFIYKAKIHNYDRYNFTDEDIQKLIDSIHFQLETIEDEESYEKFKLNIEPANPGVIFNFHEMNSIKEGKIE